MSIIAGTAIESALGNYQIERSLRFNSADSASLTWTPTVNGTRTTWTFAFWMKRTKFSSVLEGRVLSADASSGYGGIFIQFYNDKLVLYGNESTYAGTYPAMSSLMQFRDPSAWYHCVVAVNTTLSTAADRAKLYVNGIEQSFNNASGEPGWPYLAFPQNLQTGITGAYQHDIGRRGYYNDTYFNGYLSDVYLIDGQQLDASSFGEFNADTGVWQPKAYSGSYGTNGFYLNFSDNSGTTSTTLGKDYSGNSNNWTPNNFSVTAGTGNDSLVDTPTPYGTDTGAGGEVRGNYCTLNPLKNSMSMSNGNLYASCTTTAWQTATSTVGVSSGKWYFEGTPSSQTYVAIGVCDSAHSTASTYFQSTTSWIYNGDAFKDGNGINGVSYGATYGNGDVIGVALDMDAGTLTFYKNGTSQGTAFNTGLSGKTLFPIVAAYNNGVNWFVNFGQRPFAYTAPSGYTALCTQNLPDPTIVDGSTAFNTVLYTGNGSSLSVTGVGFKPDFVWYKQRNTARDHGLEDVVRGVSKILISNNTNAEVSASGISSFNADGFTVQSNVIGNESGGSYVAWNWKAGGTGVSNTDGSVTSTVSANTTSGFSIVTYTEPSSGSYTVGHGLGSTPAMLIVKPRNVAGENWVVWHQYFETVDPIPTKKGNYLNSTLNSFTTGSDWLNSLTSTVFGITAGQVTPGSATTVAYVFSSVDSYSSFGSYQGNGSADGPFIFTNFRPRYLMWKNASTSGTGWVIYDTSRNPYNQTQLELEAQSSAAEFDTTSVSPGYPCDILSNGFKLRGSRDTGNASGSTYIYAAFAENPFKYALAR